MVSVGLAGNMYGFAGASQGIVAQLWWDRRSRNCGREKAASSRVEAASGAEAEGS